MEIEKDAEVASGSGSSGSGSTSHLFVLQKKTQLLHEPSFYIAICLLLQVRGAQGTVPQELAMLILWLRGGRCDHRIQGFGWCEFLCLSDFSRARGSWKYSLSCFSEMWVSALL